MKSLSRKVLLLAVAVTFAIPALAVAADRGPVITAGEETVSEQEMIRLIMDQSGADKMMAPFVLAQLSLEDRESFAEQVSMALLLSEAALRKGLQLDPSVSVQLRWNAINILAQAYVASVSSKWDLGRPALEAWFSSHEEDYREPESVRVRHILVASEKEAVDVLLKVYAKEADFGRVAAENSIDPGSAGSGGTLDGSTGDRPSQSSIVSPSPSSREGQEVRWRRSSAGTCFRFLRKGRQGRSPLMRCFHG